MTTSYFKLSLMVILILNIIVFCTITITAEAHERNDSEYNIIMFKIIKEIYKYSIKGIQFKVYKKSYCANSLTYIFIFIFEKFRLFFLTIK